MDLSAIPLLPLDQFRAFLGVNPFHFWGLSNSSVPLESKCNSLWYEYAWQDADSLSRDDVRRALVDAERQMHAELGFRVAPQYDSQTLAYPRPAQIGLSYRAPLDGDWRLFAVRLPGEGYVQAAGVETLTLIDDNATVDYSDSDGDTVQDTFTVTATVTAGTSPLEIAVYFSSTERYDGTGAGERWRVQPVRVSVVGTTATITGRKWLLAKPALYERTTMRKGVDNDGLDPSEAANFVTTVDVYRRWTNQDGTTNETSQGLLIWEPGTGCCGTSTDRSTDPAAIASAIARVGARDFEHGLVIPGQAGYDATTGTWSGSTWDGCRQPDRVTIRYLAGYPLQTRTTAPDYGQMDARWREAVCMLAAASLSCASKACEGLKRILAYWQEDLSEKNATQEILNSRFGTRRGQVEAWKRVSTDYHTPGFVLG